MGLLFCFLINYLSGSKNIVLLSSKVGWDDFEVILARVVEW